jgi:hypothetical protein
MYTISSIKQELQVLKSLSSSQYQNHHLIIFLSNFFFQPFAGLCADRGLEKGGLLELFERKFGSGSDGFYSFV